MKERFYKLRKSGVKGVERWGPGSVWLRCGAVNVFSRAALRLHTVPQELSSFIRLISAPSPQGVFSTNVISHTHTQAESDRL